LRPADQSGEIVRTLFVGPDGAFHLANVPRNSYVLHVKGVGYLATNVSADASGGDVTGVSAMLRVGDVDGDNDDDLDDLGILALAFNTTPGDPLYDARADLDGDGDVGLDDLGLLALHFNETGDP